MAFNRHLALVQNTNTILLFSSKWEVFYFKFSNLINSFKLILIANLFLQGILEYLLYFYYFFLQKKHRFLS